MATITLPNEWALHTTHLASEFVYAQFISFKSGGPLLATLGHFEAEISLACIGLARTLADAYSNPSKRLMLSYSEDVLKLIQSAWVLT